MKQKPRAKTQKNDLSKNIKKKQSFIEQLKDLLIMFAIFFKIGLFSFGGGYAMLTLIESEIVEKRNWLTHLELGDMFAIAESTPGAIAINIATFIGTKREGIFGGIFATLGVVLPSFATIVGLSYILNLVKDNVWVSYLFKGIRVGVLVLIAKAVITFYKDMRKNLFSFLLALAAFLIVFFTQVSVIYVILSSIIISSLAVAFISFRNSRYYHMKSTPEYYNTRVGKPLASEEFFNETAVKQGIIAIKTSDCENFTYENDINTSIGISQNNDENCNNLAFENTQKATLDTPDYQNKEGDTL